MSVASAKVKLTAATRDLRIRWDGDGREGTVWMTGPATEVYSGELSP